MGFGTGDAVLATFLRNIEREGVANGVTALRTTSAEAARIWTQPVGLLFVDAVHEYEHVVADYRHWQRHIPSGGWIAFHDYTEDKEHPFHDVARAIRHVIGDDWEPPIIVENLWTARRR